MIHVWWALFAPFAGYSDVEVWMVHSTMPAILLLLGRLPCLSLSSLGVSNFLRALLWKTSWRNASELHVQKFRQKKSGGYISSVVNPECCADCSCATAKHLQDNVVAQQQAGKLQDLMGGRQRSSTAWMIAPFIVGRSGWQFDAICDISAGYASFWTWEWLVSRRIVSGWHAASTADMENVWTCFMRLLDMLGTPQLEVFLHLPKR